MKEAQLTAMAPEDDPSKSRLSGVRDALQEGQVHADRRKTPSVTVVNHYHFHAPVIIGPEVSIDVLMPYLKNFELNKTP